MKFVFATFSDLMSYPASMLAHLAQSHGWDVDIIFISDTADDAEIATQLEDCAPDMLALTLKTFERPLAIRTARVAKSMNIKVIAGGPHPTAVPPDLGRTGYFDAVVSGDGAGVLPDILDGYKWLDNELIVGKRHKDPLVYLNRFFSERQEEQIRKTRRIDVFTAHGCPYQCHFCGTARKVVVIPQAKVMDDLEHLVDAYGVKWIMLHDDTFTYSKKRVREYRTLIQERGLDFRHNVFARVDCFDEEIADELLMMGVDDVTFGVETPTQRMMDFLKKDTTVEQAYEAARVCREKEIAFKTNLMFGIPTQTEEDYRAAVDFVREAKPNRISCFFYVPLPGTVLYDYCVDKGHLPEDFTYDDFRDIGNDGEFLGWSATPGILKGVDYELGARYIEMTKEADDKNNGRTQLIMDTAEQANQGKWLIIGGRPYFYWVLSQVSKKKWDNLLGYINIFEEEFSFDKPFEISIDEISWDKDAAPPETVVTTFHKGPYFYDSLIPMLKEKYGYDGPVLSVGTHVA
ncbi:MAG: B12-binding domain-containing radical SAM protein [Magnetovibrionaceae bacterium]